MPSLHSGDLGLDLAPDIGGAVTGFYLVQDRGRFDLMRPFCRSKPARPPALGMGMFAMLPFANCIRDNRFTFDGKDYVVSANMAGSRLNFHGSGWLHPWSIEERHPNHTVLRLVCSDLPYSFIAAQTFDLSETSLKVTTSVTNQAPRRMPFGIGQHPWFPRHGEAMVRFRSTAYWVCDREGQTTHRAKSDHEFDFSKPRAPERHYQNRCYVGWDGSAEICWPKAKIGLLIRADEIFRHLMFHVPADDPETFCLEPQSNAPCGFDGLEHGRVNHGVHILEPGETLQGDIGFSLSIGDDGDQSADLMAG